MDRMYDSSPYHSDWGKGDLSGWTSYYMNKAAYLHSLAHLALTTHTFYMTVARSDYTEWTNIRDKY